MRVLVTGGTGFIGHNLVLELLEQTDWEVTVVDAHTYSGEPRKLVEDPRYRESRVHIVSHDLVMPLMTHQLDPSSRRPNVIFNLAANSHVDNSIRHPVPFIMDNVAVAVNMLEFAREVEPQLFVQFSTDEVYGPAPEGEDFEEWAPIIPSNPYSASKAAQDAIATSYWRTYDVPVVITNSMNVIGPGQHPEKFLPKVVGHLLAGEPVPVHAELIEQAFEAKGEWQGAWQAGSRFYTHVSNVSSALQFISKITPALYGTHQVDRPDRYHIVGEREVFNDELVRKAAAILGVEPHIEYVDFHSSRPGHDRRYALDGHKLARLGWTPPVGIDEGLRLAVEAAAAEQGRKL